MKITVLGCWAPYPRAGGACSGYLLADDNQTILIDCGNGVFANLQKYHDFRQLSTVILTHLHPDHYLDIYCLRHAVANALREKQIPDKVKLYLPFTPAPEFNLLEKCADAFEFYQLGTQEFNVGDIVLRGFLTTHPLETYGIVAEKGDKKIVYTSDTAWFDELPNLVHRSSLLIAEASIQNKDRGYAPMGHLTAQQAGELGAKGQVKRLLISHFWPEYDLNITRQEAEVGFGKPVLVAEEGLVIR